MDVGLKTNNGLGFLHIRCCCFHQLPYCYNFSYPCGCWSEDQQRIILALIYPLLVFSPTAIYCDFLSLWLLVKRPTTDGNDNKVLIVVFTNSHVFQSVVVGLKTNNERNFKINSIILYWKNTYLFELKFLNLLKFIKLI